METLEQCVHLLEVYPLIPVNAAVKDQHIYACGKKYRREKNRVFKNHGIGTVDPQD